MRRSDQSAGSGYPRRPSWRARRWGPRPWLRGFRDPRSVNDLERLFEASDGCIETDAVGDEVLGFPNADSENRGPPRHMGKCQGILGELDRMMADRIGGPHCQQDLADSSGCPTHTWCPAGVLVGAGTGLGDPREVLVSDSHGRKVEPMISRPQRVESHNPGGSNHHPRSRDRRTGVDPNTDGDPGHHFNPAPFWRRQLGPCPRVGVSLDVEVFHVGSHVCLGW